MSSLFHKDKSRSSQNRWDELIRTDLKANKREDCTAFPLCKTKKNNGVNYEERQ